MIRLCFVTVLCRNCIRQRCETDLKGITRPLLVLLLRRISQTHKCAPTLDSAFFQKELPGNSISYHFLQLLCKAIALLRPAAQLALLKISRPSRFFQLAFLFSRRCLFQTSGAFVNRRQSWRQLAHAGSEKFVCQCWVVCLDEFSPAHSSLLQWELHRVASHSLHHCHHLNLVVLSYIHIVLIKSFAWSADPYPPWLPRAGSRRESCGCPQANVCGHGPPRAHRTEVSERAQQSSIYAFRVMSIWLLSPRFIPACESPSRSHDCRMIDTNLKSGKNRLSQIIKSEKALSLRWPCV